MDEGVLYPVCPYRNVPAAFARFHGHDSGGVARFFREDHLRFLDGLAAAAPSMWLTTRLCGAWLARTWDRWTTHPQLPLRLDPHPTGAWFIARDALSRAARFTSQLRRMWRARLARAWSDRGLQPQLPLFLSPQPIALAIQ